MSRTESKPKTPGLRERILRAETIEDVEKLAAQAVSYKNVSDKALRLVNRAAAKRREELTRI